MSKAAGEIFNLSRRVAYKIIWLTEKLEAALRALLHCFFLFVGHLCSISLPGSWTALGLTADFLEALRFYGRGLTFELDLLRQKL